MEKVDKLREIPMFEAVPPTTLEPLAQYFVARTFERGDLLWKEGTPAHNFTFITHGKIKVLKYRNDGKETTLGIFNDGDPVGQIAVYQRIDYPASAIALDDTEVLQIHRDHFFGTLKRDADLLEATINSMMRRNHHLVRRIHELATDCAEQRLAMLFEKFSEKMGRRTKLDDGSMGIFVDLPLSRRDIAELINTRVETAIRIMSRWNKEGPVKTEKTGFLIVDAAKLQEIATEF
ncbi:Crp/Fnr family transcriptional regulator [Persicimonas caeni]|nr:Crp/Fnr family transcriptional regulator [Persicimonas caeni]